MALITCPECGKEISNQAETCPICGYPLSKHTDHSLPEKEGSPSPSVQKKPINKALIAGIAIFIVIGIAGIYLMNKPSYALKHTGLGHEIFINMNKNDIDNVLGNGTKSNEYYFYMDDLTVLYKNGNIHWMSIGNNLWETGKGVKVGDKLDDIYTKYGEEELTDVSTLGNGNLGTGFIVTYYLDKKGKPIDSILDAHSSVSFHLNERKTTITGISISNQKD